MILGLTGGIASGKSTVSKNFEKLGIEIVDADKIAREVSERIEIIEKLVEIFGMDILDKNTENYKEKWKIDRKKLREVVFKDRENIKKINSVIHPKVIEVFEDRRKANLPNEIIIFDIPLLFEAGLEYLCDKVVVVAASKDVQIERIRTRDGSSVETAKNIIGNQMSTEEKLDRGNYIINNNKGLDELKKQVLELYEKIKKELP